KVQASNETYGRFQRHCLDAGCNPPSGRDTHPLSGTEARVGLHIYDTTRLGGATQGSWAQIYSANVYVDDPERPTLEAPVANPSAWVSGGIVNVTMRATDPGLGIASFHVTRPSISAQGGSRTTPVIQGCNGLVNGRCPPSWIQGFNIDTADLPEGSNAILVKADDLNGHASQTLGTAARVDKTPPQIQDLIQGSLTNSTGWITDPNPGLDFSVTDTASGVKKSTIRFDGASGGPSDTDEGKKADGSAAPCDAQSGCERLLRHPWTPTLEDGRYSVSLAAEDAVGRPAAGKSWNVKLDRSRPTVDDVHGPLADAEGWVGPGQSYSVVADTSDGTSGVSKVELLVNDEVVDDAPGEDCTADSCREDPGPKELTWDSGDVDGEMAEINVRATDKAGQQSQHDPWEIVVDSRPPTLEVSGGLYSLNPSGRDLHVDATDGGPGDLQSGVESIELRIDKNSDGDVDDVNEREGYRSQGRCDSCPLDLDYQLPASFAEGAHRAQVKVVDHAGNETVKRWTFYVVDILPGSRSRLGLEDWFEYDSTETGGDSRMHVNAETGNVVWHSMPVVNPGRGLSTFVNLTYNSLDRGGILGSAVG
ncbi:MAG TPA: hypothetical protein VF711_02665, partial [Acidimicrobiales bacterium]